MRRRLHADSSGQSLLEFALLFPLMFLLVVNVVNFGGLLYAYITVTNAARTGGTYALMGPSSVKGPALPTAAEIQTVVNNDLVSLPHASYATVNVCGDFGGAFGWPDSSGNLASCTMPSNPPAGTSYTDPQPAVDNMGVVQVLYTYCPFIPTWNFPAYGIYSTLPSCTVGKTSITGGTTIDRRAAVRLLQ